MRRRRGRRTAAAMVAVLEVELEEVEEGARDDGTPEETSSALNHSLQRYYDSHRTSSALGSRSRSLQRQKEH